MKAIKSTMTKSIVILAGGGHASVIADILLRQNYKIEAVVDVCNTLSRGVFQGIPLINDDQFYQMYPPDSVKIANGFGFIPGMTIRKEMSGRLSHLGYTFETIISEDAVVSEHAIIEKGVQILPGVVIQAGVMLGEHTIINTRAVVEHDTHIGRNCHIAPGAVVCGGVACGDEVFIGANATLIQNVKVGNRAVIGAAALVRSNVGSDAIFF